MAKKSFAYKVHVNEVLRTYPEKHVNVYNLIDNRKEYIPDVFMYLLELFSNLNKNNSNKYIAKILIAIQDFYECFNINNIILEDDIVKKLYDLGKHYQYFLKENNIESDKIIVSLLSDIYKKLCKNYPQSDEEEKDDLFELQKKIEEKEREISNLEIEMSNLKSQYESTKILSEKKAEQVTIYKKKNNELQDTINQMKKEKKELMDRISCLIKENEEFKNNLEKETQKSNDTLLKLSQVILERDTIKMELQKREKEAEKERIKKIRENKIDAYIISKIVYCGYTVGDLCAMMYKDGYDYSIAEVKESLKRIKKNMTIQNSQVISMNPEYKASTPIVITDKELRLNCSKQCYELLVTADWHLDYNQDINALLIRINKIYNYCAENNINFILNLGDFFNVNQTDNLKMYEENIRLIEELINIFPTDKLIRQGILGGNHDRRLFKVGIDPIKIITESRDDFLNIGYDDARIKFNDKSIIGLHHPGFYNIQMSNLDSRTNIIREYLRNYYKSNGMLKKDMYLDLFGHFHGAYLDSKNGFVFVPPFMQTKTNSVNSLFHLKIFFNDKKQIDYIIIKSLVNGKKLRPIMENVYTKKQR